MRGALGIGVSNILTPRNWQAFSAALGRLSRLLAIGVLVGAAWLGGPFAGQATAGEFNTVLEIGAAAPAWKELPGVDGKRHSLADLQDKDVVVVVFTCNSCPIARDYEARIIAFAQQHAGPSAKTAVVAINVNRVPADSLEEMKKRAEEKKFPFAYLYDDSQQIARDYGATFTPEFFVMNRERKIVYMGGMDDSSDPAQAKKHYLTPAVTAALEGKTPEIKETVAIGCRVRYDRKRAE